MLPTPRAVDVDAVIPDTGRPVQFVRVPLAGVPRTGVTKVGLVANTKAPVPVSSVMAEIKLALEGVAKNVATPVPKPDTPVLIGSPVQFVNVPELGVPNTGVVKVGLVNVLFVNVSVEDVVTMFTPSMVTTPALERAIVVSVA